MTYASARPVLCVECRVSSERTRPAGIKQINLTQRRNLAANVTQFSFESQNLRVENFRRLSLAVSARSRGKLPKYKCMVCGNGLNAMKCKCGNKDENKFAFSNRCTDCEGEGVRSCFKCGGAVRCRNSYMLAAFYDSQGLTCLSDRVLHAAAC